MQLGLLGDHWWSWEAGGSFEPCDEFDVRVVVYSGNTRQQVEEQYPTVKDKSDYRPIGRAQALRYLDEKIAELASIAGGPEDYDFRPLQNELEETRRIIRHCLPR